MLNFNSDTIEQLKSIPGIINKTFPIPARFRSKLPSDVAELSRLLTNKRGERRLSYLGRPNFLSAYLHYFLPWNLYRLCLLLQNLDIKLSKGDIITDLGSGTLTFVSALWIARPDLRSVPLEFYCVDRSSHALEAGKKFFSVLAEGCAWKINAVKEEIDLRINHERKRILKNSALVCAINMFNEIYESIPHNNTIKLKHIAANAAWLMGNYAKTDSSFLIVEPGIPQSGKFISFLRESFLETGRTPLAPCTHTVDCPLVRMRKKWCHFAYENFDAPKELVRLSAAAKLPKERLVFSYLLMSAKTQTDQEAIRVISDDFPLPKNLFGRYGCCVKGLVLLAGEKSRIEKLENGSLVTEARPTTDIDVKSGAVIMKIDG